jgi:hypothetical protein
MTPRVASQQPPDNQSGAFGAAVGFKTIACVLGTAWFEFALSTKKWAQGYLVDTDYCYCCAVNDLHLN